jgi:transcriptional regulator with XRE-family HTH domain
VIGRNVRALRIANGIPVDRFAAAARFHGLRWSNGRVSDLEGGRVARPTIELVCTLAAVLAALIGEPVAISELLAGDDRITLTDKLSMPLDEIREGFNDGIRSSLKDNPLEWKRFNNGLAEYFNEVQRMPDTFSEVKIGDVWLVSEELRDADLKAIKKLGVSRPAGIAAMAHLWKQPFTAERDKRAGADANAQKRGQVSRQLLAELREVLGGDDR